MSKANTPTVSSIAADVEVSDMELEYNNVCSALNLDRHFDDDDVNSETEISPAGRNDLNLTEDMSSLQIIAVTRRTDSRGHQGLTA